jgi:hypothetical protein
LGAEGVDSLKQLGEQHVCRQCHDGTNQSPHRLISHITSSLAKEQRCSSHPEENLDH